MNLPPGMLPPGALGGGGGPGAGLTDQQMQEQRMIKYIQAAQESCVGKSAIAGTMGFGLGAMFGVFMSGMRYDTPLTPQSVEISQLPLRQQLARGFRETGRAGLSSARNFGLIGLLYSGTECCIEGLRGKNDLYNSVATGSVVGGLLAARAGPQAALAGAGGFAAFSLAIDYYMRLPPNEERNPVI